jgi:hypothetical protein
LDAAGVAIGPETPAGALGNADLLVIFFLVCFVSFVVPLRDACGVTGGGCLRAPRDAG